MTSLDILTSTSRYPLYMTSFDVLKQHSLYRWPVLSRGGVVHSLSLESPSLLVPLPLPASRRRRFLFSAFSSFLVEDFLQTSVEQKEEMLRSNAVSLTLN